MIYFSYKTQGIVVLRKWKNWDGLYRWKQREQLKQQSITSNQNTLAESQLTEVIWQITAWETKKLIHCSSKAPAEIENLVRFQIFSSLP